MSKRLFLIFIVLLVFVAGLLPVLSMLFDSFLQDGRLSLAAYNGLLTSARQWRLMGHSLGLSSLVTLLTVLIGTPLGVLLSKTNLPFQKFFSILFIIPLLIPPYIMAVSWFDLLGQGGLLTSLFGFQGSAAISPYLFGLPGCVFVLFSIFLPIPMLMSMVFLRMVNPALEEAARMVSGWSGVLKGVTVPLIMPGVLFGGMLVFLLSFGEFSVPDFLRYDVFPVESFTQFSAFYNFKAATAAAMPLALVTLLVLLPESFFLRDRTYSLRAFSRNDRLPPIVLGRFRKGLFAVVAGLGLFIVIIPLLVLILQSAQPEFYAEALNKAGDSLLRSLSYAFSGATLLTITGFFLGYLVQKRALSFWRSADSLSLFLFALPGTVIGIGLIGLWNTAGTNFIYGTSLIIILGYLGKYTALTSRMFVAGFAQIPSSMEEAAQVAGAGWFRRIGLIVAPLARRSVLAAWLAGYIFSLRDTGITMLVYPAGHETLPVRIFTLMANGSPQLIAALCVIMILATLLPLGIGWAFFSKMRRKAV